MNRAKQIERALDRLKVRTMKVRGDTQWAVYDGRKQVTNASGYTAALQRQRALTVELIEKICGGNDVDCIQ